MAVNIVIELLALKFLTLVALYDLRTTSVVKYEKRAVNLWEPKLSFGHRKEPKMATEVPLGL